MILKNYILFLFSLLFSIGVYAQRDKVSNVEQAIAYYQNQQVSKALDLLDDEIQRTQDPDAYELKSQIEYDLGRLNPALYSLTKAIERSIDRADLYFKRGMLFYENQQFLQAIDDFSEFITSHSNHTTGVYFRLDPFDQQQAVIQTSNMLINDAYMHRGLAYDQIDSVGLAISDISYVYASDSTAESALNLGLLYLKTSDSIKAKQMIKSSITIDPNYALGWYNYLMLNPSIEIPLELATQAQMQPLLRYRAVESLQQNNLKLAESLTDQLMRLYPNNLEANELRGRYFYHSGQFEEALVYYQHCLHKSENAKGYHLLLGNTLFQLQTYKVAVSHYELYLSVNPSDHIAWFNAAVAYHRLGDKESTCRCIEHIGDSFSNEQLVQLQEHCQ